MASGLVAGNGPARAAPGKACWPSGHVHDGAHAVWHMPMEFTSSPVSYDACRGNRTAGRSPRSSTMRG